MIIRLFLFLLLLAGLAGCSETPAIKEQPIPPAVLSHVSYIDDIRPIFEAKCVACHSCFDAPCQLKLEADSGLLRGATTAGAYDGTRLKAVASTRLGIDADTEQQWRDLGFHSVLTGDEHGKALLHKMVEQGKRYQYEANKKLPTTLDVSISRNNICPSNEQYHSYQQHHALAGMPFAVTGLTDDEYALLAGWLEQGAMIDEPSITLSKAENSEIASWEKYLNRTSNQRQLVSRWLYEHLFLGHLYFENQGNATRYFELVRSYTPPGEAIQMVKTRLPNEEADADFYYRLRPIHDTIVHKRHIKLRFDQALRDEIDQLFFAHRWQLDRLPGYGYTERANPFLTYQAIPSQARYQFMLNHAEYFVQTFIRGPVCRGQIATDVIRDQFWVMFQKPEKDLFVTDKAYAYSVTPLLGLPGQDDRLMEMGSNWDKYKKMRNIYMEQRYALYGKQPELASLDAIWDGNTNALLTVFRHFDSASVRRGFIGAIPDTVWWLDYPLFERTYYELVVNFDVYGNVAHQLQTRLYFDLIRNGAEHNFLRLLPADKREAILDSWYQGLAALKSKVTYASLDMQSQTSITYQTDDVKTELAEKLLDRFAKVNVMHNDPINRCQQMPCARKEQQQWIERTDTVMHELTGLNFKKYKGLKALPEMTFVRVTNDDGERTVYSLIRNRYHTNVAFLFGESLRYKPQKDTLTVYPGIAGSYPNFIFDIPANRVSQFKQELLAVDDNKQLDAFIEEWGVRRTHPQFWQIVHDFTQWQREHEPLEAGIFDVNRYENL